MTACICRLIGGVSLVLIIGCGDPAKPKAFPVTGKVMYRKTTPAADALIVFHPTKGEDEKLMGGKPFAKVKEDGTFVLTSYESGDGAPAGEYGITVDWQGKKKESKFALTTEGGMGTGRSMLNPKYGNPQQPFMRVTVKADGPNDFTIDVD